MVAVPISAAVAGLAVAAILAANRAAQPAPITALGGHLVVIVDGFMGLRTRPGTFQMKAALEAADGSLHVLIATAATPFDTLRGVAVCAALLSSEVQAVLARFRVPPAWISFVGHSMGGVIAAEAAVLLRAVLPVSIRFGAYISTGAPLLGAPERAAGWVGVLQAARDLMGPVAAATRAALETMFVTRTLIASPHDVKVTMHSALALPPPSHDAECWCAQCAAAREMRPSHWARQEVAHENDARWWSVGPWGAHARLLKNQRVQALVAQTCLRAVAAATAE